MLEEIGVTCPFCGETTTVLVDCSAGDQRYVEDCFVCCQPIELAITIDAAGDLLGVDARPENG